jgi:2-polyprenyl-6-methoxyphenol hydroxylase-like FAD-dependent oxidoreductase
MRPLRIGIAGAGPAGLSAAIAFARNGHSVTVLEKHAQLAPVGAGILIQPQGLNCLRKLGVRPAFDRVSVPIHRLLGTTHRGWQLVNIEYSDEHARAVSRMSLSSVLYEAARAAGASIEFGRPVKTLRAQNGRAHALHEWGADHFDIFLIADGAASTLREQVGMAGPAKAYRWGALHGQFWVENWDDSHLLQQRFRGTSEMMGLMPTQLEGVRTRLSLYWSLPNEQYAAWKRAPLSDWLDRMRSLWPESLPVIEQIRAHTDVSHAIYRHTWPRSLAAHPFATVGDAAHSMSPQLGMGTTLAIQDALALASAVQEHGPIEGLPAYSSRRLMPSRGYQTLSRILTPCFQAARGGLLRDLMFVVGRRVPGMEWAMKRSLSHRNRPDRLSIREGKSA